MQLRSRNIQVDASKDEEDVSSSRDKKNLYEWKPSKDNSVLSFCRDSTLHGIQYIGDSKTHICGRLFWVVVLISLASVSFVFISYLFQKYNDDPIIVSYQPQEISLDQIPFPAITICNNNLVRQSTYLRVRRQYVKSPKGSFARAEAQRLLQLVVHYCRNYPQSFSARFNYSLPDVGDHNNPFEHDYYDKDQFANISAETLHAIRNAYQPCEDFILLCLWRNEPVNCSHLFQTIHTDVGYCCQFNGMPMEMLMGRPIPNESSEIVSKWKEWNIKENFIHTSKEGDHEFDMPPWRQKKPGKESGLSLLIDPELEEYFWPLQDGVGFTLMAGSPIDFPEMAGFGVGIGPSSETFVDVSPEITMADPNINNLSLEKRLCYFHGEFTLKYFVYYTIRNCRKECVTNKTLETCGCVRIYMPRDPDTKICGTKNHTCTHRVSRLMQMEGFRIQCSVCHPSCTSINYLLGLSKSPLNPYKNMWRINETHFEPWADKNTSIVHIYFGSESVHSKYRQRVYDKSSLISDAGGLLSLYLGFSIYLIICFYSVIAHILQMSLLEVIYHFIFKILFEKADDEEHVIFRKCKAVKAKLRTRYSRPRQVEDADAINKIFFKSNGKCYPWMMEEIQF